MPNEAPKKIDSKKIIAFIIAAAVVLAGWYFFGLPEEAPPADGLSVHIIDVGQGDSVLVLAQGRAMLIDGGERGNEDRVVKYLKAQGVEKLDYVVATHPHSDHIGGLAYGVIDAFPCGTIIAPRLSKDNVPATRTYEALLEAIRKQTQQGAKAAYAKPGDVYALGEASFTILGPLEEDKDNQNNNSVIVHLTYGGTSALFTGDAEKAAENALVKNYAKALDADLFKAGHHGSNTSNTAGLLQCVSPEFIAISVGAGNDYGHPSDKALQRFRDINADLARTDTDGTVVYISDGTRFVKKGGPN